MLRIAVPDLVSNSYFPAIAAVDWLFQSEGYDASIDFIVSIPETFEALLDGALSTSSSVRRIATLLAFPSGRRPIARGRDSNTYWFLVVRSDLNPKHGI